MTAPASTSMRAVLAGSALALALAARPAAAADGFILIDRSLTARAVENVIIHDHMVAFRDEADVMHPMPLADCLAIVRTEPPPREPPDGVLLLADGQRLPGTPGSSAPASGDRFVWSHPRLGRVEAPLDRIAAASLAAGRPLPVAGAADVVVLSNGDRLEGFITSLDRGVVIELSDDGPIQQAEIPLDRVLGLALITPAQPAAGRRVWFRDGTVLQVDDLRIGDDGWARFTTPWAGADVVREDLDNIVGVLFDPDALVPLGALTPSSVEATLARYELPAPRVLDVDAPLGLGAIEYRGPFIVRYALPEGARRFAADAVLPPMARAWGDVDLIVRDDDREVFRARLHGAEPAAAINVVVEGSELTIELGVGANGPVQDRVRLERAAILVH